MTFKTIISRNKISPSFLFVFYSLVGLIISLIVFIHYNFEIPFSHMTRDPVIELDGDPFTGILSNFGMIIWSGTAAICLFLFFYLSDNSEKRKERYFFLMAFIITMLLLVDDLFLMHDIVLPDLFKLRERYVYSSYAILIFGFFILNRNIIIKTPFIILLISGGFFAFSLMIDYIVANRNIAESFFLEDGAKFLGIVNWAAYFIYISNLEIKGRLCILENFDQ